MLVGTGSGDAKVFFYEVDEKNGEVLHNMISDIKKAAQDFGTSAEFVALKKSVVLYFDRPSPVLSSLNRA